MPRPNLTCVVGELRFIWERYHKIPERSGRSLTHFCFMLDVHVNMHGVKTLENQEYYNVRNVKRMFL